MIQQPYVQGRMMALLVGVVISATAWPSHSESRSAATQIPGIVKSISGDTPGALQDFQRAADLYQKESNAKGYQRVQSNIRKLQQ
jgi:hypothetical protein